MNGYKINKIYERINIINIESNSKYLRHSTKVASLFYQSCIFCELLNAVYVCTAAIQCVPLAVSWKVNTTSTDGGTVVNVTCSNGQYFDNKMSSVLATCGPQGYWMPQVPACTGEWWYTCSTQGYCMLPVPACTGEWWYTVHKGTASLKYHLVLVIGDTEYTRVLHVSSTILYW